MNVGPTKFFNIHGVTREIALDDIPKASASSLILIFKEENNNNVFIPYSLLQLSFERKTICELKDCMQQLQKTKDHTVKDKIYALMRSALSASLIGSMILVPTFLSSPLAAIYCMFTLIGITLIGDYYVERIQEIKDLYNPRTYFGPPTFKEIKFTLTVMTLIGTVFLPLYEVWVKKAILEKKINLLSRKITRDIENTLTRFVTKAEPLYQRLVEARDGARDAELHIYDQAIKDFDKLYLFYNQFTFRQTFNPNKRISSLG